ncbi:MAG TPA: hypothetical protein VGJ16_11495 [Pirellulales bacterium]
MPRHLDRACPQFHLSCCQPSRRSPAFGRPRGLAALAILLSLLVVVLGTLAVGSTIVAVRAVKERDQVRQDLRLAIHGMDNFVETVVANSKPPKQEILQPALDYYKNFSEAHASDNKMLSELASAKFHLAGLQAKLGSKEAAKSMFDGVMALDKLSKDTSADPDSYPSLQDSALKLTTPIEWFMVKGADRAYQLQLIMALTQAKGNYEKLSNKYPASVPFRDNYSALLKGFALFQSQMPNGKEASLDAWLKARDVLEALVREQPKNADYQARLAESLLNAARMQKDKDAEQATANLKRAVEVREQMLAAKPDDKQLQQESNSAKRELERLATAKKPEAGEAKEATAAADDKKPEAADKPAEEPAEPAPTDAAAAKTDDAAAETGPTP